MQESEFDEEAARENLQRREIEKTAEREQFRLQLLQKTIQVLQKEFQGQNVEVWLIGSIIQANLFSERSDIDIVIKNFLGDRFALWSHLEGSIDHEIEIIRFEECGFQDDICLQGKKVL